MEAVAATETVTAGTEAVTLAGTTDVITDIRVVVVLGTVVETGCSLFK